ncbi:MAG: Uma2 family endonuclease [Pirellulales bacterium]
MAIADLLDDLFPIRIPAEAAENLSGFRAWVTSEEFPENWRASFLRGEILLDMSPEETETHNKVKWEIGRAILTLSRILKKGTYYGDGVLLTHKKANLSTEPDGMFVSKDALRSGRIHRIPRKDRLGEYVEFVGTPDLVVEVVSRSSWKKDAQDLFDVYYRAGIPEYWLIDALGEEIDFKLLRRGDRKYIPVESQRGWLESQVFGRRFKLSRARDEDGDWQYDLKAKK